jgi:Mycoplasma protein of unknown function, DUF285
VKRSGFFFGELTFNQNLSSWNVASVTDMSYMFFWATAFNQEICWENNTAVTSGIFFGSNGKFSC